MDVKTGQPQPCYTCTSVFPKVQLPTPCWDLHSLSGMARAEQEIRRLFGAVKKWDFSLPTFVCPSDQPEVLCLLLEFLLADLLGLDQMEYSCRGGYIRFCNAQFQVWILCPLLTLSAPGSWFGAGPAARAWWELGMNPGLAKAKRYLI